MSKILLLENKRERQKNYHIDFRNLKEIDNVLGDDECNGILKNFLDDNSIFDKYETIIIHKGIYFENARDKLFQDLKNYSKKKNLVIFSGENSQVSLRNNVLEVSAISIYKNIEEYVSEYSKNLANILILGYGKKWEANILLNILEKINIFIEENQDDEEFDFDEFEDEVDLLELKKLNIVYATIVPYKNEIRNQEITILRDRLYTMIEEKSYE